MRTLTVAEWHELKGILEEPLSIEDFMIIFDIDDIEYKIAKDTNAKLNDNGRTEITFICDDGDGLKIEIIDDQVTHIYAL
jgi:hypothetical protein